MKSEPKICFVCSLPIRLNMVTNHGKFMHKKCEKVALKYIAQAYEMQKQWEEKLNGDQKKILKMIQAKKEMTVFEISEQTNIGLFDVQAILNSFGQKIKKNASIVKGEVILKYKFDHDIEQALKYQAKNKN